MGRAQGPRHDTPPLGTRLGGTQAQAGETTPQGWQSRAGPQPRPGHQSPPPTMWHRGTQEQAVGEASWSRAGWLAQRHQTQEPASCAGRDAGQYGTEKARRPGDSGRQSCSCCGSPWGRLGGTTWGHACGPEGSRLPCAPQGAKSGKAQGRRLRKEGPGKPGSQKGAIVGRTTCLEGSGFHAGATYDLVEIARQATAPESSVLARAQRQPRQPRGPLLSNHRGAPVGSVLAVESPGPQLGNGLAPLSLSAEAGEIECG